jgi:hypothetical protein
MNKSKVINSKIINNQLPITIHELKELKKIDYTKKYNQFFKKASNLGDYIQTMEVNSTTKIIFDIIETMECNIADIEDIIKRNTKINGKISNCEIL